MTARLLIGDVFERLEQLDDDSADLVCTSPPFLALRSYLPADHPDKAREIGSERTPAEFIDTLLVITAELGRVLAPHGSLCVELGDTYAGSGGGGGDYKPGNMRGNQPSFSGSAHAQRREWTKYYRGDSTPVRRDLKAKYERKATDTYPRSPLPNMFKGGGPGGVGWPLPKSLTGIPTLYAWSLAYGFNLLTGEPSPAGQWRIRNLVHWVRPNPPVGALGDKFRPGTSYLIVACRSSKRWFDLDAVRQAPSPNTKPRVAKGAAGRYDLPSQQRDGNWSRLAQTNDANPAGAPPLDWWRITARGYKGSHYAVFPPELCERPIKAMCPPRVCTVCGEPSRRLTKKSADYAKRGRSWADLADGRGKAAATERNRYSAQPPGDRIWHAEYETVGWSDCGHDAWRPGVVLDPFAGTGTALLVAAQNDRDSVGIDLDIRNAALAYERLAKHDIALEIYYGMTPTDVLMGAV